MGLRVNEWPVKLNLSTGCGAREGLTVIRGRKREGNVTVTATMTQGEFYALIGALNNAASGGQLRYDELDLIVQLVEMWGRHD